VTRVLSCGDGSRPEMSRQRRVSDNAYPGLGQVQCAPCSAKADAISQSSQNACIASTRLRKKRLLLPPCFHAAKIRTLTFLSRKRSSLRLPRCANGLVTLSTLRRALVGRNAVAKRHIRRIEDQLVFRTGAQAAGDCRLQLLSGATARCEVQRAAWLIETHAMDERRKSRIIAYWIEVGVDLYE